MQNGSRRFKVWTGLTMACALLVGTWAGSPAAEADVMRPGGEASAVLLTSSTHDHGAEVMAVGTAGEAVLLGEGKEKRADGDKKRGKDGGKKKDKDGKKDKEKPTESQ